MDQGGSSIGLPFSATEVDHPADSILITDIAGKISHDSPALAAPTGYRIEEVVGQHASIHKSGLHPAETC